MGRRKGLVGFYVGMGAVLALVVTFYFAWTPLRALYWEREVRKVFPPPPKRAVCRWGGRGFVATTNFPNEEILILTYEQAAERPVGELVSLGPAAEPALRRLLALSRARKSVLVLLGKRGARWALPLVVEHLAAPDEDPGAGAAAVYAAERFSGEAFFPRRPATGKKTFVPVMPEPDNVARARRAVLDWWEREGRARYGRGGE